MVQQANRVKNVLISTTRQWNPGDEFVLMGCIDLLQSVIGDFNPILFNRSPEVRQAYSHLNPVRRLNLNKPFAGSMTPVFLDSFLRLNAWDNSFKDHMDGAFLDMAVFAGSPEWSSRRLTRMYQLIDEHHLPTLFLGIGNVPGFEFAHLNGLFEKVMRQARLVVVRDRTLAHALAPVKAHYLPCPALFAVTAGREKEINSVKRIGLIYGHYKSSRHNNVSEETYRFLGKLYALIIDSLKDDCEIELVCHYIDELPHAVEDYPDRAVRYSFDARDYIAIYGRYDLVIGPRIHGIGLSASLGIPGMVIKHDFRGDAADGFKAQGIALDGDLDAVLGEIHQAIGAVRDKNRVLIHHKRDSRQAYLTLLAEALGSG